MVRPVVLLHELCRTLRISSQPPLNRASIVGLAGINQPYRRQRPLRCAKCGRSDHKAGADGRHVQCRGVCAFSRDRAD